MKRKKQKHLKKILSAVLSVVALLGYHQWNGSKSYDAPSAFSLAEVGSFDGVHPYVVLEKNVPDFTAEQKQSVTSFEDYAPLDDLGRCGVALANLSLDLMPQEERTSIGMIKPSGWQTVKYDHVDGKYLYNRCHLIAYQLAGENANEKNLITGTRYMNTEGMLPFENEVADYIKETGNHVLYRVTPIFSDRELVARGVVMEAYSIEDQGQGIQFHVYCFNVQPGVEINYATGQSKKTTMSADNSPIAGYLLWKRHYDLSCLL